MGTRKLLCLNPDGAAPGFDLEALAERWDVHTVTDPVRARELSADGDFRVGLALLDHDPDQPGYEDTLLASTDMQWVAMLPAEGLEDGELRRLIHNCFFDFHTLPADLARLEITLGHAYGMASLSSSIPAEVEGGEYEMVGASPVMQQLFRTIRKIAAVDAPVLIQGESGTGKELAALAVHQRSSRGGGPFIAVNCGALPANLIQSELFGHEKGAFTGAHQRKIGRMEAAAGGTIFLDEVGDLPLDLQVNLLRFLQEHRIERLGSTQSVAVDVRVIAATHVDLDQAVAEGRFREDLYYRLNVLRLEMPALRERGEDIELLARFFFERFGTDRSGGVRGFSRQALRAMREYRWPGNVRELINRVRRAMIMCEKRLITADELGLDAAVRAARAQTLARARAGAEQAAITSALEQAGGNVSEAARQLGVSRVTLYRLMEKYRIRHRALES